MTFRPILAAAVLACASTASAQSVNLQFDAGRVTLVAENAPVRAILTEWSRLGGTRMVNAERIVGAPVTLELRDVTERQALEILLRSAVGYVITDRETAGGGASTIGGVVILATSSAPRVQPPVTFGPTVVQQQRPPVLFDENGTDAPRPIPVPFVSPSPGDAPAVIRGNVTLTPPDGAADAPPPAATTQKPTPVFTTMPGTARPGEITPPPPQQPGR